MKALRRRPRIAFLCQSPGVAPFTFEKWHAWRGMAEAIRARGGDLLYVAGGDFERDSQAHVYRLLSDRHIDGLIAWQAFVYPQCTDAAIYAFLDRYSSLPFVSMERAIAGHPCVLLDTRQGMQALLAHLVDFHGYRKIVCLAHGARSA